MTHLIKMISLALVTTGLFSVPALAKQKSSLDDLNCTQEGAIAKISGGEWVCGEDLTGGGSGASWIVLDSNDSQVGTFFGLADGGGTVNFEQKHPSIDVVLDISGEAFLVTVFGSGFGSRSNTFFDGPGCTGNPMLKAEDIRKDTSFDGLYGTQGFVSGDPMRTLRVPVGPSFFTDVVSSLGVSGDCWEPGSPFTEEVIQLDDVVELHSLFTPPFRMEPGF